MLRKIIEAQVGKLTDNEFRELIDLVTSDIKGNNLNVPFKRKRTSLRYLLEVAVTAHCIMQRYIA